MKQLIFALLLLAGVFSQAQAQTVQQSSLFNTAPPTTTVAALPACTAAFLGATFIVSDALTPAILSVVIGGGAVTSYVRCNGTSFLVI